MTVTEEKTSGREMSLDIDGKQAEKRKTEQSTQCMHCLLSFIIHCYIFAFYEKMM